MLETKVTNPPRDREPLGESTNHVNCPWLTESQTVDVLFHISRAPPGARFTGSQLASGYKGQGWTVEVTADTPTLWCATLLPRPATR